MRYLILLWLLISLVGCQEKSTAPTGDLLRSVEPALRAELLLSQGDGIPESVFRYGENICIEWFIVNETGVSQPWSASQDTPPLLFYTLDNIRYRFVTENFYGVQFPDTGIAGVLPPGDTLYYRTTWLEWPSLAPLPVGPYLFLAQCPWQFDEAIVPATARVEFEIIPVQKDAVQILGLTISRGLGFCPWPGIVYSASVLRSAEGVYTLWGNRLTECDPEMGKCFWGGQLIKFIQQIPFRIILSVEQVDQLETLIAEFPDVRPIVDGACDPCQYTLYHFGDDIKIIDLCTDGPPEYLEHMWDIRDFIHSLVYADGADHPSNPAEF